MQVGEEHHRYMVSQALQQTDVMSSFEYQEQNIVSLRAPLGMDNNAKFTRCQSFEKSAKALRGCFNSLGAVISCLQNRPWFAEADCFLQNYCYHTVHTLFGRLHWYNWFTIKVFIVMQKQK